MASKPARHGRGAFTLVELLVVISIFVLLLAIAVPAFSSMMRSSAESLAENSLKIGLAIARDAAARNPAGRDTAAVFFYDPETKHTSILACESVGMLIDQTAVQPPPPITGNAITREVFVPVTGYEPVQLPRGWNVRGYAPPSTIDLDWYEDTYQTAGLDNQPNWLFPETDFLDVDNGSDGQHRQTFMVRFEGGTGLVKMSDLSPVLVYSLVNGGQFRSGLPWSAHRGDQADDAERFVRSILAAPLGGGLGSGASITLPDRRKLVGNESSDTVLAKPVGQIAVYDEKQMLAALKVRADPDTQTIYLDSDQMTMPKPAFVSGVTNQTIDDLNAWIEGHLLDGSGDEVPSDCRIFGVQRYLGTLQELTGSRNAQGVQGGGT
jgi:prepilin-type N-terminal cleavage/methylation domain-containing protein